MKETQISMNIDVDADICCYLTGQNGIHIKSNHLMVVVFDVRLPLRCCDAY